MTWPVIVKTDDGSVYHYKSVDQAPLERVVELMGPATEVSTARVLANLSRGETVRRWQTQVKTTDGRSASIATFAIFRHGQPVAYLYFPPDGVPMLTTSEQQWQP